jgi:hypothetical protein
VRDVAAAKNADVFLGARCIVSQTYPRANVLSEFFVRHAEDLSLLDRGMTVQEFLYLSGKDVFTTAD